MPYLVEEFKQTILPLLKGESQVAVAVSGGSDSMALALLAGALCKKSGIKLIALTVDHGLRAESKNEAMQVSKWLLKHNIEHHTLCWLGDKKSSNIQSLARKARYNLMAKFCAANNIKTLLVGHTLNDQAETVLMRLMRGSGVDGLSGIEQESNIFGVRIVRPILSANREELREYLINQQQEWIEDPSNQNIKFTRVKMRNLINSFDDPELMVKRLADTARHMARAKNYINAQASKNLAQVFTFHNEGYYTVNTDKFKSLHAEEQLRALAAALKYVSGNEYKPRFENLDALNQKINNDEIGAGCTLWGCELAKSKKKNQENILFIYREPSQVSSDAHVSKNMEINWDGRFIAKIADLSASELNIGALGKSGFEMLLKAGFSIKSLPKIPRKVFYTLPAIKTLEKLLAVPHIGYYSDEKVKFILNVEMKSPPDLFKN